MGYKPGPTTFTTEQMQELELQASDQLSAINPDGIEREVRREARPKSSVLMPVAGKSTTTRIGSRSRKPENYFGDLKPRTLPENPTSTSTLP
jgi:hypothetical protein